MMSDKPTVRRKKNPQNQDVLKNFYWTFFVCFITSLFFAKICEEKQTSLTKKDKQKKKKSLIIFRVHERESVRLGKRFHRKGWIHSVRISHIVTWAHQGSRAALPQSGPLCHISSCPIMHLSWQVDNVGQETLGPPLLKINRHKICQKRHYR